MSTESKSKNKRKRTRTKNTSTEQYNIYLHFMENDYNFRSNTSNPTLGENYLENKWDELKCLLNGAGDGPQLTSEEWKKRFIDWKYAVRMKFRKISDQRNKTGSGPTTDIKLTTLEERALNVWGKVVVTESPFLSTYNGLNTINMQNPPGEASTSQTALKHDANSVTDFNMNDADPVVIQIDPSTILENSNETIPSMTNRKSTTRTKPLLILAENISESSRECAHNSKELNSILKEFAQDYIKCKKEKLKFKIEKYKFENPLFQYDF